MHNIHNMLYVLSFYFVSVLTIFAIIYSSFVVSFYRLFHNVFSFFASEIGAHSKSSDDDDD